MIDTRDSIESRTVGVHQALPLMSILLLLVVRDFLFFFRFIQLILIFSDIFFQFVYRWRSAQFCRPLVDIDHADFPDEDAI